MISTFKPKVLLVDGNFLLKRSFNGAKHVFNNERHIGGLYQFIMTLRSYIRTYGINKAIVFWDGQNGGKIRYNIYPLYKSNRENKEWYKKIHLTDKSAKKQEDEQSILWQSVRIKQYLEELFIRQIEVDQMESDDLIAYYCKKYHEKENIIIYTNDRDLCQLLEYDNVCVYLDNVKMLINKKSYYLLFKHHFKNLCLMKTLTGDASDCIKGIQGLAEPTLLKYFPEIAEKEILLEEVLEKSKLIAEQKGGKTPKVIDSINRGIFLELGEMGVEQFKINQQIIDLLNPMLTKQAMSELVEVAEQPLDSEGRGSKNLLKYMTEDGYLTHYNRSFVDFCKPFYPLILREKDYFKKK